MASPNEILKKYWGFDSFRSLQEDIIESVLNKNDTLALLPTGGGKSICFQVPALCLEGICIVVSPLISLMNDQVENLKKKGINAIAITSAMQKNEIDIALDNCIYGKVKFLYCSPERLNSDLFKSRFEKMNVSFVAVDEAHCISQWGYDFRPQYLKIIELKELKPDLNFIALTATATPKVVVDIQEKLDFKHSKLFQKSFYRDNLSYSVLYEDNKYLKLEEILSKINGSVVIYAKNRKHTQDISAFLKTKKHLVNFYHAGLTNKQRALIQSDWINNKTRIIVATNAFGMGIDKPDVRLVIHMDVPDSIEAYFQEAGRAGRDEKKAFAVLLHSSADSLKILENIEKSFPEISFIRNVYQALGNYYQIAIGSGLEMVYEFNISEFCNRFNLKVTQAFNALKILELNGYITLSEAFNTPSLCRVIISQKELYNVMVKNKQFEPIISTLIRSYSGIFEENKRINETTIGNRIGKSFTETKLLLQKLDELNHIEYKPSSDVTKITFTLERKDHKVLHISNESYLDRKKNNQTKAEKIIEYVESKDSCRSKMLLAYFGENKIEDCGKCDFCTGRHKTSTNKLKLKNLTKDIIDIIKVKPINSSDLLLQLPKHKKEELILVLRSLVDNEEIKLDKGLYFI